ncbi:hypothetical protein M407DRAFT_236294, partial [Tulasnella calospora MUT 4182]
DESTSYGLLKALLGEVFPWYRLEHPNISPFIGYTFDDGSATLVSEWQQYGHVMNYLRQHPKADRLELIAQAAEALAYLHEQNSPLIHGDIKPENVLVSHEGIIKLTDFGISTVLHQHPASDLQTSQSFRGTLRYADPALLGENPKPTTFTDLWAFAWLIFGILTERRPYDHIQSEFTVTLSIMNYEVPCSIGYPYLEHGDLIWPILKASWSRSNARRWPASCIARYIRQGSIQIASWASEPDGAQWLARSATRQTSTANVIFCSLVRLSYPRGCHIHVGRRRTTRTPQRPGNPEFRVGNYYSRSCNNATLMGGISPSSLGEISLNKGSSSRTFLNGDQSLEGIE